jgi:hypothetical protein
VFILGAPILMVANKYCPIIRRVLKKKVQQDKQCSASNISATDNPQLVKLVGHCTLNL